MPWTEMLKSIDTVKFAEDFVGENFLRKVKKNVKGTVNCLASKKKRNLRERNKRLFGE